MKKLILLIILSAISCKSESVNGIYYLQQAKNDSIDLAKISKAMQAGVDIGCSLILSFDFKNGKCTFSAMGVDQTANYKIENGYIYIGQTDLYFDGVVLKIINDTTLQYQNCKFKKDTPNEIKLN